MRTSSFSDSIRFPKKAMSLGNPKQKLIYIMLRSKYQPCSSQIFAYPLYQKSKQTMSKMSFLKFQYGFPGKSSPRKNPPQMNSFKSRQTSSSGWSVQAKSQEVKWVFDKFDTNKDGKISLEEYKAALRAIDRGIGDTEAVKAFQVMDSDGDGFIDFKEFMEMFNGGGKVKDTELQSAFQVFDLDGDGKISAEELSQVLRRLGEGSSLSACKQMVKGVDGNGDGFIDLNEFIKMMTSGKKLI